MGPIVKNVHRYGMYNRKGRKGKERMMREEIEKGKRKESEGRDRKGKGS